MNFKSSASAGKAFSYVTSYGNPDVIWTHPKTGGKVYVGCLTAASEIAILEKHGIYNIINCQEMSSENFHEKNKKFTYFRFPIAMHYMAPMNLATN